MVADVDALAAGELAIELLLADVVLLLPGALLLPDALPDWLADGVWLLDESCFFSCATAPNDSNAAATATAMDLNFMGSPFLDDYPGKGSKLRAP